MSSSSQGNTMRRWPWALAIAAVVIIWVVNLSWILGPGAQSVSGLSFGRATFAESSFVAEGAAQACYGEAQQLATQTQSFIEEVRIAALSERDLEFSVDPNRATEWNYEPNGRKVVYLTFDDGPSDKTQAVLDILDRYGCKATFFVTASQPDYFYQIGAAYRKGHTIGLHTASHDYAQVYSSKDAYFADLGLIGQIVREQIGYVPCFIRFPGGSSNEVSAKYSKGIMSQLVNEVPALGYQYYDWNASSGDGSVYGTEEIVGFSCGYDDLDNIVLLMHDSATKQTTVDALPRVIEHYRELGYSFEAIDRTTIVPHHSVTN